MTEERMIEVEAACNAPGDPGAVAWAVLDIMQGQLFSTRTRFRDNVQKCINVTHGVNIHPEDVIIMVRPEHVVSAALATVREERAERARIAQADRENHLPF